MYIAFFSNIVKLGLTLERRGQSTQQARFSKGAPKKDGGGQLSKICTPTCMGRYSMW